MTNPITTQIGFWLRGRWVTRFEIGGRQYGGYFKASQDERLTWFFERFPNAKRVLELGSLEGGHTFPLAQHPGIEYVLGIEGRQFNVNKARYVQRLLGVENAKFVKADLEKEDLTQYGTFDAVFCLGLLYHLPNPWDLVAEMRKVSSNLFLWTHYALDDKANQSIKGYSGLYYKEFGYQDPLSGLSANSFWPTYDGLFEMLKAHGYSQFDVVENNTEHLHGPAITLAAFG